ISGTDCLAYDALAARFARRRREPACFRYPATEKLLSSSTRDTTHDIRAEQTGLTKPDQNRWAATRICLWHPKRRFEPDWRLAPHSLPRRVRPLADKTSSAQHCLTTAHSTDVALSRNRAV